MSENAIEGELKPQVQDVNLSEGCLTVVFWDGRRLVVQYKPSGHEPRLVKLVLGTKVIAECGFRWRNYLLTRTRDEIGLAIINPYLDVAHAWLKERAGYSALYPRSRKNG